MKWLTRTVVILLISNYLFAQKGFYPGWVLKNGGDTIRGFLQEEIRKNIIQKIEYKSKPDAAYSKLFNVSFATVFP